MNEKIVNTLTKICENNGEYAILYIPKHNRISLVYTSDLNAEILYIETINNTEYKFESDYEKNIENCCYRCVSRVCCCFLFISE